MADCACQGNAKDDLDLTMLSVVFEAHANDPGALIPILQETQAILGYLPESALREIARQRDIPLSEVYGVASFYTQFHQEPRGETIVKICHGTACHVAGAPEITRAITEELGVGVGETSEDMRFTVEGVACIGCCGLAPVVVIGDQTHGAVDGASARKLAKQLTRKATR